MRRRKDATIPSVQISLSWWRSPLNIRKRKSAERLRYKHHIRISCLLGERGIHLLVQPLRITANLFAFKFRLWLAFLDEKFVGEEPVGVVSGISDSG